MITRRQTLALVALTLMWGINWPMMKLALREMTPLYFRAVTMSAGALCLYLFYRWRGVPLVPRRAQWRSIITLAAPNMLGWHMVTVLGVRELASGRAAILGFTMPIWIVLISVLFLGERLTRRVALAAVSAALAIGLLLWHELVGLSGRPVGVAWMELGAVLWAVGTLMMRRSRITLSMEALTVWMMIVSSLCLWLVAWAAEPWPGWQYSGALWTSLVYGVLVNYGVAQVIWFGMARDLQPSTSAMSIVAVPVIGTLSATLIVGEWPHWQDYAAIVFVLGAIAAVLLPPPRTARTAT